MIKVRSSTDVIQVGSLVTILIISRENNIWFYDKLIEMVDFFLKQKICWASRLSCTS